MKGSVSAASHYLWFPADSSSNSTETSILRLVESAELFGSSVLPGGVGDVAVE